MELTDTLPGKSLEPTNRVNFGASQLNPSVRRLLTSPGSGQLRFRGIMGTQREATLVLASGLVCMIVASSGYLRIAQERNEE